MQEEVEVVSMEMYENVERQRSGIGKNEGRQNVDHVEQHYQCHRSARIECGLNDVPGYILGNCPWCDRCYKYKLGMVCS